MRPRVRMVPEILRQTSGPCTGVTRGRSEHRVSGREQEIARKEIHGRRPDPGLDVRTKQEPARDARVPAKAIDLDPDVGRRVGHEVLDEDGPVRPLRLGAGRRRLARFVLERGIGKARDRRQARRMSGGELALFLLLAQAEDQAVRAHARRVELFVEKIEGREGDRCLLHAEVPLDVRVAAAHRQAARFDHPGHPGGRRFVIEEKLLRIAVDPAAQQTRRDDDVQCDTGRNRNRSHDREDDPDPVSAFHHPRRHALARGAR